MIQHIKSRCFVNAPFNYLEEHLSDFIAENLQPEIGLEGDVLYRKSKDDFTVVARTLHENGLSCTLHAPFFELSVGALDKNSRQVSRAKLKKAFDEKQAKLKKNVKKQTH